MLSLPLTGSHLREALGDMATFVEMVAPANRDKLPSYREALARGRRFMEGVTGAKACFVVCWGNCNFAKQRGKLVLLRVGPRGGQSCVWIFGA